MITTLERRTVPPEFVRNAINQHNATSRMLGGKIVLLDTPYGDIDIDVETIEVTIRDQRHTRMTSANLPRLNPVARPSKQTARPVLPARAVGAVDDVAARRPLSRRDQMELSAGYIAPPAAPVVPVAVASAPAPALADGSVEKWFDAEKARRQYRADANLQTEFKTESRYVAFKRAEASPMRVHGGAVTTFTKPQKK